MKARSRDSEGTRRSILNAAQRLFARNGFAGTSLRDVAKASGVSQPLTHHYFGSKEGLYRAIKQRLVEEAREALPPDEEHPRDIHYLTNFIRSAFEFVRQNEDLLKLATWSNLEGESSLWPGAEIMVEREVGRFRDLQARGMVRSDLNPLLLLLMTEALTLYWCQNRTYYMSLFEQGAEDVDERYLAQVLNVMLYGIKPRKEDEAP